MTTTLHPMPLADAVARTLGSLVGLPVRCESGRPVAPAPDRPAVVATYVDENEKLVAAWICELSFAASSGAALVRIPADVAAASAQSGTLSPRLAENFREVVNVAASLFNAPGSPHVRLRDFQIVKTLSAEVAALARTQVARLDLLLAISGYAPGCVSVLGS